MKSKKNTRPAAHPPSPAPAGSELRTWDVWWGCEHHCNLGTVYAHSREGALMTARLMYPRVLDVDEVPNDEHEPPEAAAAGSRTHTDTTGCLRLAPCSGSAILS